MRVTQIIADLHVPDLKAAKGFYTDYLGLTEEEFNPSTTACGPRPCGVEDLANADGTSALTATRKGIPCGTVPTNHPWPGVLLW